MLHHKTTTVPVQLVSLHKFRDYAQLIKLRVTVLVVFSAAMGYIYAAGSPLDIQHLFLLLLSGFLITGSANGINQIIEKNLDKLMSRTANRPVATVRLSVIEACILTTVMGITGIAILALSMNALSAFLGLLALLLYAFAYTPLKKITPLAVLVGSFPGALPPVIGYTDVTGFIDVTCLMIFAIQFIWQFPHFWAVAWLLDDDYKKAGFQLLPSKERNKRSAMIILLCTALLIPLGVLLIPSVVQFYAGLLITAGGIIFFYQSYRLYKERTLKAAKQLMFGSFFYLPLVQIILVIGKLTINH